MHIVFVHTPMATVPVPEREMFWQNFDVRYHGTHPGLRHMNNVLWELPHWMHWLGGVLVDAGFTSIEAIDLYTSECTLDGIDRGRLELALRRSPGDVYLFSPMTPNQPFAYEIADLVKELYPTSKTVFGGVVATPLHKRVAAHPSVDYVVYDRGEYALPALMRALRDRTEIEKVGNLAFKSNDGTIVTTGRPYPWMPVNEIPHPKIDLFDRSVGSDIRYLRQVYALGCPYRCSFCTIQTIGRKADYFHIDRVISEIHAYRAQYGNHHNVYFGDETFTVNKQRTLDICAALKADGTIRYDIQTRLNCLTDPEVLRALKDSGCAWIEIGIETIDQDAQDQHKQRLKLRDMRDTLARVHDAGLATCSFMVNGFPNQTLDDMKRSLELGCELLEQNYLTASYLFGLVPYPGSDLYKDPESFGMKLLHHDFRLYHEEMLPVYETRHAKPDQMHRIFLDGIKMLGQAMAHQSDLIDYSSIMGNRNEFGSFWHGSHV
jgi:anaerobic magnesium-protoporphyrin IX monomethyl ester cyclase